MAVAPLPLPRYRKAVAPPSGSSLSLLTTKCRWGLVSYIARASLVDMEVVGVKMMHSRWLTGVLMEDECHLYKPY